MQRVSGRSRLLRGWMMLALGWAWQGAIAAQQTPHVIVQSVTDELVLAIQQFRPTYETAPDQFYAQVGQIISPVIDFGGFSRAVMGEYGTSQYLRQLDSDQARKRHLDRYQRFTAAVKARMVQTLSKGLMTFSGEQIEVVPADAASQELVKQRRPVSVTQLIYRRGEQPLAVNYKLRYYNQGDDWRMINVVLNNINLGKQYRTEFNSKLAEFGGDLDKVIDYWAHAGGEDVSAQR
jgi:phospholipid transport system substrate-binding protein